jgi:hypothetical protein
MLTVNDAQSGSGYWIISSSFRTSITKCGIACIWSCRVLRVQQQLSTIIAGTTVALLLLLANDALADLRNVVAGTHQPRQSCCSYGEAILASMSCLLRAAVRCCFLPLSCCCREGLDRPYSRKHDGRKRQGTPCVDELERHLFGVGDMLVSSSIPPQTCPIQICSNEIFSRLFKTVNSWAKLQLMRRSERHTTLTPGFWRALFETV